MSEKKTIFTKVKENKWKILTGISITTSAILGTMYGLELYKNKQGNNTAELVKRVVGGPLIDRLIKNEEKTLSRLDNKIIIISKNGLDENAKLVLKDLQEKRQNVIETIADFVLVRDALK